MKCLIGIDDKNLIVLVENILKKIDKYIYVESTSNLETVKKLLQKNQYDFMLASCCQNQDHSQKMLGWIRAMKIDIEVIRAVQTRPAPRYRLRRRWFSRNYAAERMGSLWDGLRR